MPDTNIDIAIIGAGIIGSAVALELSKVTNIAIISDPKVENTGTLASGASLGVLGELGHRLRQRDITEFEFRIQSNALYPQWIDELEATTGQHIFKKNGTFIIGNANKPDDSKIVNNILQFAERYKCPLETVDAKDIPGLKPNIHNAPSKCLYLPQEKIISSFQLMTALDNALKHSKRINFIKEKVITIRQNKSWNIFTDSKIIRCNKLCVCSGYNSLNLLPKEIVDTLQVPELHFAKGVASIVHNNTEITHAIRTPNRAFSCGSHVVPRENNQLYLGATNYYHNDSSKLASIQIGDLHILYDQIIHQINTNLSFTTK